MSRLFLNFLSIYVKILTVYTLLIITILVMTPLARVPIRLSIVSSMTSYKSKYFLSSKKHVTCEAVANTNEWLKR